MHIGHINHFKEAKKLGDILIVTVTQDKYVNKGPNRPIFSLNTRMESIAALKDIDYVYHLAAFADLDKAKNNPPVIPLQNVYLSFKSKEKSKTFIFPPKPAMSTAL